MDIKTPEERSRNMAAIRSRNTAPECFFRHLLFARGFRYRIAPKGIPGRPDLYLPKYHAAIFVHGCFWHRHAGCRYASVPKSNAQYWNQKFQRNQARDREVAGQLRNMRIRVLIVWECTIKSMRKDPAVRESVLDAAADFLRGTEQYAVL